MWTGGPTAILVRIRDAAIPRAISAHGRAGDQVSLNMGVLALLA